MGTGLAAYSLFGLAACTNQGAKKAANSMNEDLFFKISLAQWSLHKSFFGKVNFSTFGKALQSDPDSVLQGKLDPIDFPTIARQQFNIDAVEFVNTFYFSKAKNKKYLKDLKGRCKSEGVQPVLIMCDALGDLGDLNDAMRKKAVENHYPWVDAAKYLGCHSIRVNAAGKGTAEEVKSAAVDGLGSLTEYGKKNGINIIVENHGGYSSNGQWLAAVIGQVNDPYCGTLPDFGNFCIERKGWNCTEEYDRYQGVKELMPYAKGVSAKTHNFDADGNETKTDFRKMLKIVKDAGYTGHIDIEYEGSKLSEIEGIKATKALLERVGKELS
jgi:sugar phosphate isomerase/epimerase